MYGSGGDRSLDRRRSRSPRRDGYGSHSYGYTDYGRDSYRSSSEAWTSSRRARYGYHNQTKRTRYGYSERDGAHRAQPGGSGDPRGRFEDGVRSSPTRRRPGHYKQTIRSKKWKKKMVEADKKMMAMTAESGSEEDGNTEEPASSTMADGDREDGTQKETEHAQSSSQRPRETQHRNIGDRMVDEIKYTCSICQFHTFYDEEMNSHLQSDFHKEHFRYMEENLPEKMSGFLQEYVQHRTKKTENRRRRVENLRNTIYQIHRKQDFTLEVGMEHFMRKVEAAHCAACHRLIPMDFNSLQGHLKSASHNKRRKFLMEKSEKRALGVAKGILKDKDISRKVEQYVNGENPFLNDHEEDSRSVCSTDLVPEADDEEEEEERPCITLSDSEREEEDDSSLQVAGEEDVEYFSYVCEDSDTEVDASDRQ